MLPRFSIIIPVYNVAPYLKECLGSISLAVEKYGKSVELICVDDGSTDDSGRLLDGHEVNKGLIAYRVVHQANAGVSVARNKGLEIATGEYICFVDGDDSVKENWLIDYAQVFEKHNASLVRMSETVLEGDSIKIYQGNELREWSWKELAQNGYNWRYAVRRDIAEKARFPEGVTYCEDSLFTMQLIPYLRKTVQLPYSNYNYRFRPDSAMRQRFASNERLLFLRAIDRICKMQPEYDMVVISRSAIGNVLAWAGNPKDVVMGSQIYEIFHHLISDNVISCRFARTIEVIPIFFYSKVGWIWPVQLWNSLITICVYLKHLGRLVCRAHLKDLD